MIVGCRSFHPKSGMKGFPSIAPFFSATIVDPKSALPTAAYMINGQRSEGVSVGDRTAIDGPIGETGARACAGTTAGPRSRRATTATRSLFIGHLAFINSAD